VSFNVFGRSRARPPKDHGRLKLEALRLDGQLPLAEKELRGAAGLKVGKSYDPLRLQQAADKARNRLVEKGWRGASVDAITEPVEGGRTRIGLVLRVDAGPQVVFSWTGDDPGERIREQAKKAWPPYASPEAAAVAVARAARIELQAQGFYDAKVEHRVELHDGQAEVALTVARGPVGSRVELAFDGNAALTDETLAATMPKPGSREFFDALDRAGRLTGDARLSYANAGYLRARVGPPRPAFDAKTGVLTVTIPVRERGPSRVTKVALPEEVREAGSSPPALALREGEPFDVRGYLADRDAIAAWYRRAGWMEARVRGVLQPKGDDVDVAYMVDPGPRPRRGDVRIATEGRTNERVIRRAVEVEPGTIIRPQELSQTRARLSELNLFTSVDVRQVPVDGRPDLRDLEVTYSERPDVEVEYGVRYQPANSQNNPEGTESAPSSSKGAFKVAGAAELANPFGYGWRFRAFTLQTTQQHNYRFGLESSTLFGYRVRTQLLWFDETEDDRHSFASKVRGYSVQQQRVLLRDVQAKRWHDRLRLQWGYTDKDIAYSAEIGSPTLVQGNRAFISLSLIGDERDSLTDPHKGLFWTATTEVSRKTLGSDVNYNRYYGQLFTYLPLPFNMVWAQGYRIGVVPGTDPVYLLENRFQAGGPTTVRGFRQNGLGPQFESEGLGGQGVFVFNQELRFPIWKQLHGGIFWDAGNTWLLANEFSLGDLRHSVGGGLRFMLPFGPIRIEYGFILDRKKNPDGTYAEPLGRFVFGLGHAF
jgi:outer membrane protein assembly complex protein YaeT